MTRMKQVRRMTPVELEVVADFIPGTQLRNEIHDAINFAHHIAKEEAARAGIKGDPQDDPRYFTWFGETLDGWAGYARTPDDAKRWLARRGYQPPQKEAKA